MAVNTYALCTLVQLKAHLTITSSTNNAILESYIDAATAKIERWCGRQIKLRAYSEWYGGNNVQSIKLKQYPINNVTGVYSGMAAAFTLGSSVSSDLRKTISINTEALGTVANGVLAPGIVLTRTVVGGVTTTSTLPFSTYEDVTDMVAAINAITGFSATVVTDMRCAQLHPRAGGDIKQSTVTITGANVSSEFVYDSYLGIVTIRQDSYPMLNMTEPRFPSALLSTMVDYSAGYTTTPDDIRQACLVIAATLYLSRKSDSSLQSESLGDYSYSMASADSSRMMMEDLLGSWKEIR
jgi:hypothetical protein